jgi:CheY-like chemotaxis protein
MALAKVYHLTAGGRDAIAKKEGETTLPLEYRRLLALLQHEGHVNVLRGRLRRFPDRLIEEWLKELEELKLIAPGKAPAKLADITFTGAREPPLPVLPDEDSKRLARTTVIAGATLLRQGSFLAVDRIANLTPTQKSPPQSVILLVEDDPDQLALGELRLTMAGYQVRSVDSAKALSRFLREQPRPDLLLLDVMLPDGDGFDILGKLRARPEFAMLPIVLLTVKAELANIRKGLALGADGYITKPYSKNQLAEVIGRVLRHPA